MRARVGPTIGAGHDLVRPCRSSGRWTALSLLFTLRQGLRRRNLYSYDIFSMLNNDPSFDQYYYYYYYSTPLSFFFFFFFSSRHFLFPVSLFNVEKKRRRRWPPIRSSSRALAVNPPPPQKKISNKVTSNNRFLFIKTNNRANRYYDNFQFI